jgi:hypothetical protein
MPPLLVTMGLRFFIFFVLFLFFVFSWVVVFFNSPFFYFCIETPRGVSLQGKSRRQEPKDCHVVPISVEDSPSKGG